jgi:O-antigen/teichoic acid export membrane protein
MHYDFLSMLFNIKFFQKNFDILKKFIFYSAGNFFLKSITSSIMLITIKFLTVEEYGLLSLLNNFINIFPIILNLGLRQAFGVEYYHLKYSEKIKMLNDIIGLYLFLATPIFIISLLNINFINQLIFINKADTILILIALISCFLNFFSEFYYQILRYQCRVYSLTSAQFFAGGITILATILLVYFLKLKIVGILLANLIASICIIIWAIYRYIKITHQEKFNIFKFKNRAKYYLKLGFPFIPNILFAWILSSGNRWFLAQLDTMESVGIYSFADNFCQLFNLIVLYPLSASYVPHVFKKFATDRDKILEIDRWNLQNMIFAMISMFILITLGYFALKIFFIRFIPIHYYTSLKYIWFLLVGQIFLMGSYFATCYLQFLKRNYLLLNLTIISAVISCILNIILIPKFQIYGCIINSIINYAMYLGIILFFSYRLKTYSIFNLLRENKSL